MRLTIDAARKQLAAARSHEDLVSSCLALAREDAARGCFIELDEVGALWAARQADARLREASSSPSPQSPAHRLAGLPVTVKDLFDVQGQATLAGSVVRRGRAAAAHDAVAVARLRAAGCALLGRTNMSELAFSGVGLNPHHGTPRNPCSTLEHRIPGGSSSGAAVSVALGIAVAGLGSDTGGSLRIPAALCGLVGFKPTQSRVPREGAVELSRTLDSIGAITNSVSDAVSLDTVLADAPMAVRDVSLDSLRLAVPQTVMLDGLDADVAAAFERSLSALSAAGATLVDVELAALADIPKLNAPGGFSAIEAYAAHRDDFEHRRDELDPRVAARIAPGRGVSAADYLRIHDARRAWIARVQTDLMGFDAFLAPTVPITAPLLAPLMESDERFFAVNGQLLRNTFVVNFLDGCAFSLPCHRAGGAPVGLMLSSTRGRDAQLASIALAVEAALRDAC